MADGTGFPVVALVSSAGGLEAMGEVLSRLTPALPAAVVALQHLSPRTVSLLPEILARRTSMPVTGARDGERLVPGTVVVIPTGVHAVVGGDERVRLVRSGAPPPARPSADLLLATLAVALGPRVLAVVLTGTGHDGALGAQVVHAYGGRTLVQDQASSREWGMPSAAAAADSPGTPLSLAAIADVIQACVAT